MTFTSVVCAATESMGVRPLARVSQMRTLPSAEEEANTVASLGDHCRSSTLEVWPRKGASTFHALGGSLLLLPPPRPLLLLPGIASGSHTWMTPAQSPVASRPGTTALQSTA